MKRLAIITARGGSKGLPDKNMLMVNGKPLLSYSIEAALESKCFDDIVLTTDSEEYIELLSHYPISFLHRDKSLAGDKSSSFDAIKDVITREQFQGFDYFVLLQPTSPLRTAEQTRQICSYFEEHINQYDFCASVCNSHKPTVLTRPIDRDNSMKYFDIDYSNYSRQNYLPEYSPNGVFFIAKPDAYLEHKHFYGDRSIAFRMDKRDSIDIDDREDFEYFYFITQQQKRKELLLKQAKHEIKIKADTFLKSADISLIGDAHWGQWDIDYIGNKSVQNIAFTSITTEQYFDLILSKGLIKELADTVIISFGINDIRRVLCSAEELATHIGDIISQVKKIKPQANIYLLEIPMTIFRVDCDNHAIKEINKIILSGELKSSRGDSVIYTPIQLNEYLINKFGKLAIEFTEDGLNLNEKGYTLIQQIILQTL